MHFIYSTSFCINSSTYEEYNLTIEFFDEKKTKLSSRKFTFIQKELASDKDQIIWDVFTKNGITTQTESTENIFNDIDVREVQNAQHFLSGPKQASLMVLDLKDKQEGYVSTLSGTSSIEKCETAVCEFFKKNISETCFAENDKQIHGLLKGNLDFVLLEGSLKCDLLKEGVFSDNEIAYLNSHKGGKCFCQLAEYFMNGFKLGQAVEFNGKLFTAEKYIKPISNRYDTFRPFNVSTVLYPPLYKQMYSPTGKFAKSMMPVFSISGGFCEKTQITRLNFEVRK